MEFGNISTTQQTFNQHLFNLGNTFVYIQICEQDQKICEKDQKAMERALECNSESRK